jgi:ribosomal protein S18 acetylase RimI-like enzyme
MADLSLQIRPFERADETAVIALWQQCELVVPWNNPQRDIERKLSVQPEGFLVGLHDDEIIATVMAGYDGHRGWLNYLAVAPHRQSCGIGRQMVAAAEAYLQTLNCPKINLQIRATNTAVLDFYARLGFTIDNVICMGKRLEPDNKSTSDGAQ